MFAPRKAIADLPLEAIAVSHSCFFREVGVACFVSGILALDMHSSFQLLAVQEAVCSRDVCILELLTSDQL